MTQTLRVPFQKKKVASVLVYRLCCQKFLHSQWLQVSQKIQPYQAYNPELFVCLLPGLTQYLVIGYITDIPNLSQMIYQKQLSLIFQALVSPQYTAIALSLLHTDRHQSVDA
jgi:maltodextrin utilization protein YvdJ